MTVLNLPKTKEIRDLMRPSGRGTALFILYASLMMFGSALLTALVLTSLFPIPIKIILVIVFTYSQMLGMRLMGGLGHDGNHFSLHKNKMVSSLIGNFMSSTVIFWANMGFSISHVFHHIHLNSDHDPDYVHYSKFNSSLFKRFLFAFPSRLYKYFKIVIRLSLNLPIDLKVNMGLSKSQVRLLCITNLLFSFFWLSIYITVLLNYPLIGFFALILPNLVGLFLNSFTSYIWHSGAEKESELHGSRSLVGKLNTVVHFGGNYHLEHHLYPGIPQYRLPKVNKILKVNGIYDEKVMIEKSIKGEIKAAMGKM